MTKCDLCKSSKVDDSIYGELLKSEKVAVHLLCLYLSSNLTQRGHEENGLFGFLPEDIKKEVLRISKLRCCYCSNRYANIGCCESRCRRTFHLICGMENGAQNQFINTFNSYCHKHVRVKSKFKAHRNEKCCICFEVLIGAKQRFNAVTMLPAPCCSNGWFHKDCLQRFAMSSGYFFKCPLCNDTKTFCEKMPHMGIFIPRRDAAWELEPNAFVELLERPRSCAADKCHANGRELNCTRNPLLICTLCGSLAIHKHCMPDAFQNERFICHDCSHDSDSGRMSLTPQWQTADISSDVEIVDVDSVTCESEKSDLILTNEVGATNNIENNCVVDNVNVQLEDNEHTFSSSNKKCINWIKNTNRIHAESTSEHRCVLPVDAAIGDETDEEMHRSAAMHRVNAIEDDDDESKDGDDEIVQGTKASSQVSIISYVTQNSSDTRDDSSNLVTHNIDSSQCKFNSVNSSIGNDNSDSNGSVDGLDLLLSKFSPVLKDKQNSFMTYKEFGNEWNSEENYSKITSGYQDIQEFSAKKYDKTNLCIPDHDSREENIECVPSANSGGDNNAFCDTSGSTDDLELVLSNISENSKKTTQIAEHLNDKKETPTIEPNSSSDAFYSCEDYTLDPPTSSMDKCGESSKSSALLKQNSDKNRNWKPFNAAPVASRKRRSQSLSDSYNIQNRTYFAADLQTSKSYKSCSSSNLDKESCSSTSSSSSLCKKSSPSSVSARFNSQPVGKVRRIRNYSYFKQRFSSNIKARLLLTENSKLKDKSDAVRHRYNISMEIAVPNHLKPTLTRLDSK